MNTEESLQPERDALWSSHKGLTPACCADMIELAGRLERERNEAAKELRQISALMFGGILEDTPADGIAWRVHDSVMGLKKERDEERAKLDWLDSNFHLHTFRYVVGYPTMNNIRPAHWMFWSHSEGTTKRPTLRAAIEAAMSSENDQGHGRRTVASPETDG